MTPVRRKMRPVQKVEERENQKQERAVSLASTDLKSYPPIDFSDKEQNKANKMR